MEIERKSLISDRDGERIDKYLKDLFPQYSRSFIQHMLREGYIRVGDRVVPNDYKVKSGELISVEMRPLPSEHIEPEKIPLDIVHSDKDLIVVNKPAGMVVHPGCGNYKGTLVNALLYHYKQLSLFDNISRAGIVHRLDKERSGVMVVAKTETALNSLAKQFENRDVKKVYLALVIGRMENPYGTIEAPLGRRYKDRRKMAVSIVDGRKAITKFKVKERFRNYTLLELYPHTGRTHQIRVHLAHIGFPVIGDKEYGHQDKENFANVKRQLLHAYILGFHHPKRNEWVEFKAPLPSDFKKALSYLRRFEKGD